MFPSFPEFQNSKFYHLFSITRTTESKNDKQSYSINNVLICVLSILVLLVTDNNDVKNCIKVV